MVNAFATILLDRREDDHVVKAATLEDDNENIDGFDDSLVKEAMNMVESLGRSCEDEKESSSWWQHLGIQKIGWWEVALIFIEHSLNLLFLIDACVI